MKTRRYGIIGYLAICSECDWDAAILTNKNYSTQDVRNSIRRHVRKTGHTVRLESTSSTEYKK